MQTKRTDQCAVTELLVSLQSIVVFSPPFLFFPHIFSQTGFDIEQPPRSAFALDP